MKSHREIKTNLYEYHRGELPDQQRKEIESHLYACSQCNAELEAIRESTRILDGNLKRPSGHRNELYWQLFTEKVERRIALDSEGGTEVSTIRRILDAFVEHRKPFGIGFASALMLVMMAFGIWSLWLRNQVSETFPLEQSAQQGVTLESHAAQKIALDLRAQDYLEQSKVLLIGLMNTNTEALSSSGPFLEREQEISRKLVSESGDLTSKLKDPSQRRVKELISDLQLILIQIANLGTHHELPGVEIIKGGIEHNDILFKINLEEIQRTTKSAATHDKIVKPTT
jgi:hypothetical protein